MKRSIFVLIIIIFLIPLLVSCNVTKTVDENYEVVTLFKVVKNDQLEKVRELKDKKKIEELIDMINSGEREDAKAIVFETGPDGILVFEKNDKKLELKVFTDTGNILTEEYYIKASIDLKKYF